MSAMATASAYLICPHAALRIRGELFSVHHHAGMFGAIGHRQISRWRRALTRWVRGPGELSRAILPDVIVGMEAWGGVSAAVETDRTGGG